MKKIKKEVLIFKGDVLPKEDTRSVSYFCQSSEIYTRIRSGGTVVRAAPKTGVAQNGKLRSLGKPYSTNSPNVNPTTPGRVNNRAVPKLSVLAHPELPS